MTGSDNEKKVWMEGDKAIRYFNPAWREMGDFHDYMSIYMCLDPRSPQFGDVMGYADGAGWDGKGYALRAKNKNEVLAEQEGNCWIAYLERELARDVHLRAIFGHCEDEKF